MFASVLAPLILAAASANPVAPVAQVPLRPLSFNMDMDMNLSVDLIMGRPRTATSAVGGDEIVVTARRYQRVLARVTTTRGTTALSCRMRRESGNPSFDAMVCAELIRCNQAAIDSAPIRAMRERQESGRAIRRAMEPAVGRCFVAFIEELDARRG